MTKQSKLIMDTFSVTSFKGEKIEDINAFMIKNCIIFEIIYILKKNKIGNSSNQLININNLSDITKEITKLNKIDVDELSRNLIYFMEYSNLILEDQSKKDNFFLTDTAEILIKDYASIKLKIGKVDYISFGNKIFTKFPSIFNKLLSCFLFGSYITFGRNRVSTIYKTLDMLSLPQIEASNEKNIPCSEFLKINTPVGINMKEWGILINKYGHTISKREDKWEERSRERMYLCIYFGWASKRVVEKKDTIFLTPLGINLLQKYNELRESILKNTELSKKDEVKFLYHAQANKRGFLLVKDIKKFSEMIDSIDLSNKQKNNLLRGYDSILEKITEINHLIGKNMVQFKITNPYHSTRVHQDFHSKPYLSLLKILTIVGPCNLKELSTIVLQFKDFRKQEKLNQLFNEIKKNRKIFDELTIMNSLALGRRWTGEKNSIVTIHGSLKKYLIEFAIDFDLVKHEKGYFSITSTGKELLKDVEKTVTKVNILTQKEIKEQILKVIKKEKIDISEIPEKLRYSTFIRYGLQDVIFYRFNDNMYEFVNFAFPCKFKPWDFEGFRWSLEKAKEAVRFMVKELKYNNEDIKNKVSIKTFIEYGLFGTFMKFFKGYVSIAIMESFPERNFKKSDFRYPRIYLALGLVFQKILKKIYEALGYTENLDFLYDKSHKECSHGKKCRPDFQFKLNNNFTDKWVDAKYSNFTVFSSETLRYKEDCNELEIVYLVGEEDINIPLDGAKMFSVDCFIPQLKKIKRFDLIDDLRTTKKEIIPHGYKPTVWDRKMLEKEYEEMDKSIEKLESN